MSCLIHFLIFRLSLHAIARIAIVFLAGNFLLPSSLFFYLRTTIRHTSGRHKTLQSGVWANMILAHHFTATIMNISYTLVVSP